MAQRAFDAVKAAYETLSDPAKKETCMNVVNNARTALDEEISRKRKEMRAAHKTVIVAAMGHVRTKVKLVKGFDSLYCTV